MLSMIACRLPTTALATTGGRGDHPVPARDINTRNLRYVGVKPREGHFRNTVLRHLPVDIVRWPTKWISPSPSCITSRRSPDSTWASIFRARVEPFSSNPGSVYQAARKVFEAGAAAVLISWEYDEKRLPNLQAAGCAIGDLRKGAG